jgi:pyocin large subunit-like protein
VALTNGFRGERQLNEHFAKHASEFAIATIDQYEHQADLFLGGVLLPHVMECRRGRGDIVRFDPSTDEYGVISNGGIIRTYFKPIPCWTLSTTLGVVATKSERACHPHANNVDYFKSECARY